MEFVKSHPAGAVIAVLCVLLQFAMQSCSSTMVMLGNAAAGALRASTYPCEDREMLAAEAAYCALEDDLQHYLDTYETVSYTHLRLWIFSPTGSQTGSKSF